MSNSSRKNRNRSARIANQRGGYPAPAATLDEMPKVPTGPAALTPCSGRPIGLAPLIADALDELTDFRICGSCGGTGTRYNGGAWGGECGCPQDPIECVAELLTGCVGIPHSSVYNPVTEYVRKRVPNLDTVFTTATEIVAERGDIRARVDLPEYVADFLLTYDTTPEHFPALVMATGAAATVPTSEEAAAA